MTRGYLAIVLHAHLPFVRHPEHVRFLEENWLFEAIVETYLPLIQVMDGWLRDGMDTRLTLSLSPTLCAMLRDELLQDRFVRHLDGLIELSGREIHRIKGGKISVGSPIARALIGKLEGDIAEVQSPGGVKELEVLEVSYI